MKTHFLEIEDFSDDEVTAMFNAICKEVMNESPTEVKKRMLKIKDAKVNTKVSLTNLMALIKEADVPFSFKVTYLKPESVEDKEEFVPPEEPGIKDPVFEEMKEQENAVGNTRNIFKEKLDEQSKTDENKGSVLNLNPPPDQKHVSFDPGQIPDFTM